MSPFLGSFALQSKNVFIGLCQLDQRGDLMLSASSGGLEELYDAFRGPLIIFYHQDHSCAVRF